MSAKGTKNSKNRPSFPTQPVEFPLAPSNPVGVNTSVYVVWLSAWYKVVVPLLVLIWKIYSAPATGNGFEPKAFSVVNPVVGSLSLSIYSLKSAVPELPILKASLKDWLSMSISAHTCEMAQVPLPTVSGI